MTIVCGDSHTATHGAFGALAFGIGTSEVEMVLATQMPPPAPAEDLRGPGRRPAGAGRQRQGHHPRPDRPDRRSAAGPATSSSTRGEAIRALTMEQRMTICNMSIEGGARAGLVAPDDTTFEYVAGRPPRPARRGLGRGRRALAHAADRRRRVVRPVDHDRRRRPRADGHLRARTPAWASRSRGRDPVARGPARRRLAARASSAPSSTWTCSPGQPILGQQVDVVFIGIVHERPDQRPPPRGRGAPRPEGRRRASG